MSAEISVKCPVCVDLDDSNMSYSSHRVEDCRFFLISAGSGCPICKLLKDVIQEFSPQAFSNISPEDFARCVAEKAATIGSNKPSNITRLSTLVAEDGQFEPTWVNIERLWNTIYRSGTVLSIGAPGAKVFTVEFFLELDIARKLQFYPLFRVSHRLPSTTHSEDRLEAANTWLQDCRSSHSMCGPGNAQLLPKRVLDISSDPIRLYQPEGGRGERAQYICLSYCWGTGVPLTTTSETLPERAAGILVEQLPQTLQDAVLITRRLQIRYLWIDALCIIQDSATDWEEQSSQMAAIYRNSFLTIAAAQPPGTTAGMFNQEDVTERELRIPLPDGRHIPVWAREKIPHPELFTQIPARSEMAQMDRFPLLGRAWCFQEYLLSPRVLHFGPRELLWTCNEKYHCECFVEEVPGPWEVAGNHHLKQKFELQGLPGFDLHSQTVSQWHEFVRMYTSLRLTYVSDKLAALSGLVQFFQQRNRKDDVYLAGLWKSSLLMDLTWRFGRPGTRPAVYQAPTWSWASVDICEQCFFWARLYTRLEQLCTIHEAKCVPRGKDPTGQISSAEILLTGRLMPGTIEIAPEKRERPTICMDGESVVFTLDCWAESCGIASGDRVFLLPILDEVDESGDKHGRQRDVLILRESETKNGAYERIGSQVFDIDDEEFRDGSARKSGVWSLQQFKDTSIVLI